MRETFFSNPLIKWQRAAHNELCDRRNDQVLDAAKFKQGDGARPDAPTDVETEMAEEEGSEMAGPVRASPSDRQPYSA